MIVPVYVAERQITTPESRKGIYPESRTTSYSFEPIPDEDRWVDGTIHHRRLGGTEPTYQLDALGGEMVRHGAKLYLKTVRRRVVDVTDALCMARIGSPDIRFHRPGIAARPPEAKPATTKPIPARTGPVKQLSMFGEADPS